MSFRNLIVTTIFLNVRPAGFFLNMVFQRKILNEPIVYPQHGKSSYWTVLLLIFLRKVTIMLQHLSKFTKNEMIDHWTNATDYRQEDGKNLSPWSPEHTWRIKSNFSHIFNSNNKFELLYERRPRVLGMPHRKSLAICTSVWNVNDWVQNFHENKKCCVS